MKALVIDRKGSLDELRFADIAEPVAAAGDLVIAVKAAGVNPADWKIVHMGHPAWASPQAMGLDAAGVVTAVGPGVEGFSPGDRVYYHGSFATLGAYAEKVRVPALAVSHLPEAVSFTAAAAVPTAGYTAYMVVVDRFRLGPEDVVLVHAGAGGVGGFAIQLARRLGARVLTTCSAENAGHVLALGAEVAIDYRGEDVGARVAALTGGRGVDAILDTIGPAVGVKAVPMLAFQGRLACVAQLPDLGALQPLPRGIQLFDISLGGAFAAKDRRAQRRMAEIGDAMARLLADGEIDPMVAEMLPFERTVEALRRSREGHLRGKLVITMDQG